MLNKAIYLPGLNGLRAMASLSVVIAHTIIPKHSSFALPVHLDLPMAQYSVTLFFVISGFLITYILLLEKDISIINVGNFYVRRILKIWPLYYLYIIVCLLLALFNANFTYVISPTIYWYVFFAANIPLIFNEALGLIGHYWSIGVEEQFYFFWPWVVKIKNKKLMPSILLIFISLLILKIASYVFLGKHSLVYLIFSVVRFDSMMIGGIGAIYYYQNNNLFLIIMSNKFLQIVSWTLLLLLGVGRIYIPSVIVHEFVSVISIILIIGQVTVKNRVINLENYLCNFLGKISYGIYIIHPLVIAILSLLIKNLKINMIIKCFLVYGSTLSLTIGLAYLSYQYYETFFLKFKDKFTTIKNSNKQLFVW